MVLIPATFVMAGAALGAWRRTGRAWTAVAVVVAFMLAAYAAGLIH